MHILIGLITAIGGLLWALNSLQRGGLDLGWLNPFAWAHRRKWRQKYQQVPLYNLHNSMEAAAVLIVGTLHQEGDLSREQKRFAIDTFKDTFSMSDDDATQLFGSCTFLLKQVHNNVHEHVENILANVKAEFTEDQINSLLLLIQQAAEVDGPMTATQALTLQKVKDVFNKQSSRQWS